MGKGMELGEIYLGERIFQTVRDRRAHFCELVPVFIDRLGVHREATIYDTQFPLEAVERISEMANRLRDVLLRYGLYSGVSIGRSCSCEALIGDLKRFEERILGSVGPDDLTYLNFRLEKVIGLF